MRDLDHIGDLADELDAKAFIGELNGHMIDESSHDVYCRVTVFRRVEGGPQVGDLATV